MSRSIKVAAQLPAATEGQESEHYGEYASPVSAYLTRKQVAERYPISEHTLAKLASQRRGPRFYKPTDKTLYLPADIETWIVAAAVEPMVEPAARPLAHQLKPRPPNGRGRAKPQPRGDSAAAPSGRRLKSLHPTANSWLRRND